MFINTSLNVPLAEANISSSSVYPFPSQRFANVLGDFCASGGSWFGLTDSIPKPPCAQWAGLHAVFLLAR